MTSNFGLGMQPQNLIFDDLGDVTVGGNIKQIGNEGKTFQFKYKHVTTSFDVVPATPEVYEYALTTLAGLADINSTVAGMKTTESTTPFGFVLNKGSKKFGVYSISRDFNELLQQTRHEIVDDGPNIIVYDSSSKTYELRDLYEFLPQRRSLNYEIHLYAAPLKAMTDANNSVIKKIINSGILHLCYNADGCGLEYDNILGKLGAYGLDGTLTLKAINPEMTDDIKTQTSGTIIMEMIVNNTNDKKVGFIGGLTYKATKRVKVYILIYIQRRAGEIEVRGIGENFQLFNERADHLDIGEIYLNNATLIDFKLFKEYLTDREFNFIIT